MAIQGIFGPIDPAELGQTLIHEHLTCADWSMRMNFGGKFFDFDQVAAMAEGQLNKAKALGVRTVVDGTPINLGRDIHLIREVSRRTGLNFIASTGFYYQEEPWLGMRDEEQIYDLLMGDCVDGIAGTDSRPGILKAGVARAGLTPLLRKILHATGRVAKETGLPLFCHHDPAIKNGGEILDLLAGCGVPASKVILGHSGDSTDLEYLTAMLERGCWLGMDRFGFCDKDLALEPRVDTIAALCKAGWGHRLLLSHDWAAYLAFWDSWETTRNSDSSCPPSGRRAWIRPRWTPCWWTIPGPSSRGTEPHGQLHISRERAGHRRMSGPLFLSAWRGCRGRPASRKRQCFAGTGPCFSEALSFCLKGKLRGKALQGITQSPARLLPCHRRRRGCPASGGPRRGWRGCCRRP